ncbi:peroxidase A2-like, partial [Cryptomeria japonica]|uniref:peroxidase A2-like n=1 Tax=Cryptomeria japonica TaxID=3369 RepID=UPI0027DA70C5
FVFPLCLLFLPAVCGQLNYYFYRNTCPDLERIVFNAVISAVMNETRMAASLLRLHFHDCFVNGCDGSVLLDDTDSMIGEKTAAPNHNSARGFEVIDAIKTAVENSCKAIVSCADILTLAARDSVHLSGGPYWPVSLGRRDGKTANKNAANTNLPAPFESLDSIINKFQAVGLSVQDVVVLSRAHTIGAAHCNTFKSSLFNFKGTSSPDQTIEPSLLGNLQTLCPENNNDPNTLASLDPMTQDRFDNAYFKNLQNNEGVLQSDQTLFSTPNASTVPYVNFYNNYPYAFFMDFHISMIKLANLSVLTRSDGEIRKNCRFVN